MAPTPEHNLETSSAVRQMASLDNSIIFFVNEDDSMKKNLNFYCFSSFTNHFVIHLCLRLFIQLKGESLQIAKSVADAFIFQGPEIGIVKKESVKNDLIRETKEFEIIQSISFFSLFPVCYII